MSNSAIFSGAAQKLRAFTPSAVFSGAALKLREAAPSAVFRGSASAIEYTVLPFVKDTTNGGIGRAGIEQDTVVLSRVERITSGAARLFIDDNTTIIKIGGGAAQKVVTIGKSGVGNSLNGFLNVGGATSATSDGDIAAGNLFYDASANTLKSPTTAEGTGQTLTLESGASGDGAAGSLTVRGGSGFTVDGVVNIGVTQTSELNLGAGASHWKIDSSGNLLTGTDDAWDIGAVAATRPRTGYFGTSTVIGNTITITSTTIDSSAALDIGATTATSLSVGRSGVTTDFPSGSTVDFTGATVTGLPTIGVTGRRNSGTATSVRPQLNFIEGSNVTIAIVDDGGDDEIEVTITAASASASLFGGVSNGQTSAAASGTFVIANQGNVQWGVCCALGSTGAALDYIGFGACKGTGSSNTHVTLNTVSGAYNTSNGALWTDPAGNGSGGASVFSGSTFNIGFSNAGGRTVGILASAVGWT